MSKQNVHVFIREILKLNIHLICVENINGGNHINKQITAFKGWQANFFFTNIVKLGRVTIVHSDEKDYHDLKVGWSLPG